jgi:hypothetical protein
VLVLLVTGACGGAQLAPAEPRLIVDDRTAIPADGWALLQASWSGTCGPDALDHAFTSKGRVPDEVPCQFHDYKLELRCTQPCRIRARTALGQVRATDHLELDNRDADSYDQRLVIEVQPLGDALDLVVTLTSGSNHVREARHYVRRST